MSVLKPSYSFFVTVFIIVFLFLWPVWNGFYNPFTWDFFGYYVYLPLYFIYDQIPMMDLSLMESLNAKYHISSSFYQFNFHPESNSFSTRYPIGVSLFYLPFFGIAHAYAILTGSVADGFSAPYQISCLLGGMFYFSYALFLLRWCLLRYFKDATVAMVLFLICLSTNLMAEGFDRMVASPHALGFVCYTAVFYYTIRWHEQFKKRDAFLLGISLGLCIVVRASEVICVLIPLLWNVTSWNSFQEKMRGIWKNYAWHLLILISAMFFIGLPQMMYWKIHSGHWIYYSYQNAGEGFDFLSPHTVSFLFSFRKGWFIYTPIMIFAYLGFYALYQKHKNIFYPVIIFSLLSLWIVSSWTCWYYACSYGNRGIVQSYAILTIPLAAFLEALLYMKKWIRYSVFSLIGGLFLLTSFQFWQFRHQILECDRMTWTYYKNAFMKVDKVEENKKNMLIDRSLSKQSMNEYYGLNYQEKIIFSSDFENTADFPVSTDYSTSGNKSWIVHELYSQSLDEPYENITDQDHAWIQVSFDYLLEDSTSNFKPFLCIQFNHHDQSYQWSAFELEKNTQDSTGFKKASYEYLTPVVRSKKDKLKLYFWIPEGKGTIYIDQMNIVSFTPNKIQ
jgi:hypothetical protein